MNETGSNNKKENKVKKIRSKNSFRITEVVFLLIITCIISLGFGVFISYNTSNYILSQTGLNINKKFEKLIKVYEEIKNNYYGQIEDEKLINGAISGMLDSLGDDYTTMIDEDSMDNFNITLEGNYEGLGIEIIQNNEKIYILNVFENSPAYKSGLKAGDIILSIDDLLSENISASDFSDYVRNNKKSNFTLVVQRENEKIKVEIKRDFVVIDSVTYKIIEKENNKIGYIYVELFAANTYNQFKNALESLEKEGIQSLIIDLRDNTGGHLSVVADMLSLLVDNSHVIYQTEDINGIKKIYSTGSETKLYPIVLLVNGNSASASEIMTGTLRDELNAIIVGEKTYGKGTVQELKTLPDGTQYKITIKKWLTSGGNLIDGVGISPDYEVSLSDEYFENPIEENDNQLKKAIEVIK